LNVYDHESMIIGKVYEKNGDLKKAKEFYDTYRRFVNNDQTVYRNLSLAFIYCQEGNREKALEHLRLFAREDNILYWLILFINKAPDMTPIERSPEFQKILQEIERKFWANHDKLRLTLEEKGVM
ncbi:MAG: AraC family transcriptional regulator, partial [Bacteroidota bacterium]